MRVLLDNDVPRKLRRALPGHEVETSWYRGWHEAENGDLLRLAVGEYDALVTADKDFRDRPERRREIGRLTGLRVVFIGGEITDATVLPAAGEIDRALRAAVPGRLAEVYVTERARGRAPEPDPDPRGRGR